MSGGPRAEVRVGDVREGLAGMEAGSVSCCVTSPPYSSGGLFRSDRQQDTRLKCVVTGLKKDHLDFSGDNRDQRSFGYWSALWLSQCLRVTRSGGVLCMFTDWRQLPTVSDAIQAGGWIWRGVVPWDKTEGCRPTQGRFANQCEYVLWASKGGMPQEGKCLPGLIRVYGRPAEKVHIAGKPVSVIRELLRIIPAGGVVLDPFAGAGSTGMACLETGHRFIGFEIDRRWSETSRERLATMQRPLFLSQETTEAPAHPALPLEAPA